MYAFRRSNLPLDYTAYWIPERKRYYTGQWASPAGIIHDQRCLYWLRLHGPQGWRVHFFIGNFLNMTSGFRLLTGARCLVSEISTSSKMGTFERALKKQQMPWPPVQEAMQMLYKDVLYLKINISPSRYYMGGIKVLKRHWTSLGSDAILFILASEI